MNTESPAIGAQPGTGAPDSTTSPAEASEPARPTLSDFEHRPQFTGSGGEYFRIWIVNIFLSIVTLGIYSAWATVRNRRYLYGNIDLDRHRFDFHGRPLAILKGRVIAVAALAIYLFGGELHLAVPWIAAAVFIIALPLVMVLTLRFRLANTGYRGLRFGFTATSAEAYRRLWPFQFAGLVIIGFYGWMSWLMLTSGMDAMSPADLVLPFAGVTLAALLLFPMFQHRVRELVMNHIRYGTEPFTARLDAGAFWAALGLAVLTGLGAFILIAVVVGGIIMLTYSAGEKGMLLAVGVVAIMYLLLVPAYVLPFAIWHTRVNNHVVSRTRVGQLSLRLELKAVAYWWILLSNGVVAVLTLGLAIPWAKVRMLRYRLSRTGLSGPLDDFAAADRNDPSALGDELGSAFELDLGI